MCTAVCFDFFFFFKQKTAYEMRISDWSSDVCSSDLLHALELEVALHDADRRDEAVAAQQLLGRRRNQRRIGAQILLQRRVCSQVAHAESQCVDHGVESGDEQDHAVALDQVVRHRLAFDLQPPQHADDVVLPIGLALLDGVAQHRGDGLHHPEVGRQVWRNRRQMSLGQLAVLALLFFRQAEQLQEDLDRIDVGDVVLELAASRSEEHTSELQSLMRSSYAVFCLKKK